MKRIEITEAEAQALRNDLIELEEQIRQAREEHGAATREEGGLFSNSASHVIFQDIERWEKMADAARTKLNQAIIIKVDSSSEELSVDIGDIVETEITYEGEEPTKMKFQIDGLMKISGVARVTYASPVGKALRGKKVGESFSLKKLPGSPVVGANGVVLGIVKAKDLESNIGEMEPKKPYTLEKHS